eukprot:6885120-Pyramimonas_sp.AAC.1
MRLTRVHEVTTAAQFPSCSSGLLHPSAALCDAVRGQGREKRGQHGSGQRGEARGAPGLDLREVSAAARCPGQSWARAA